MMVSSLRYLQHLNPMSEPGLLAGAVGLLLPALLFSPFLPGWAPQLAMAGLGLLFLLRGLATGCWWGHTPVDGPLLLLAGLLPLQAWAGSYTTTETLPRTYAMAANLAVFWAVAAQRERPWLRWSGWLLLLGGLGIGLFLILGIQNNPTKLPFIDRSLYELLPGGFRPFWNDSGFNSNLVGGLLALFVGPSLVLIWQGNSWPQRDLAKVVALITGAIVLLAQSRGALLGLAVALPLVSLVHSRRWLWLWLGLLLAGLGWSCYTGPGFVTAAILSDSAVASVGSLQSRLALWERAFYLMWDFPWTGVGLGGVEPAIQQRYPLNSSGGFQHAHNLYLQVGAELGLLGFLAYLSFYATLLGLLIRTARDRRAGSARGLALALLAGLITFLVHGFFEVITYAPRPAVIVWALFGLMVAVATSRPVESRPQ
jgi:putative inorganic carbon (HCO3(-)) transporter